MFAVEKYDQVRRMVLAEGKSQREAARECGVSRNTVRKMIKHGYPPGYRRRHALRRPAIDPVRSIIDAWLDEDLGRPRKQRHTAFRIYERLRDEHDFQGSYSAVQRYVAHREAMCGEKFFPLQFDAGEEAQVDWGEAWISENGEQRKVFLFCMRLCHSTASFVQAYEHERQEAFLDGHVRAFAFFGGVPRRLAYDNLKTAVVSIGRGRARRLTQRFMEFKSACLFDVRFCNVRRGNEKGHVENLVKYAQRKFMTPMPSVVSLKALNEHLMRQCEADLDRAIPQRGGKTRRQLLEAERQAFLPLPNPAFEACCKVCTKADKFSLVRFDGNDYSVPTEYARRAATVKGFVDRVDITVGDQCAASHERSYDKGRLVLAYEHYLPLLERKPGGIHNAAPFKGEPWGEDLEHLHRGLKYRYRGEGTRKFVRVLLLLAQYPESEVKAAVRSCVRQGIFSDEAVQGVLTYQPRVTSQRMDLSSRPKLAAVQSALPDVSRYDRLVEREALA
jgi:transposase